MTRLNLLYLWKTGKRCSDYPRYLILLSVIDEWFESALAYPGVQLLNLTLPIIVESTKLTHQLPLRSALTPADWETGSDETFPTVPRGTTSSCPIQLQTVSLVND